MPMKPGKDESQSDFMTRCVPEMMGDGKRPQEQAVAACMTMWRDAKNDGKQLDIDDPSIPDPDDDETADDFLERCTSEVLDDNPDLDEDEVIEACQMKYDERAQRNQD